MIRVAMKNSRKNSINKENKDKDGENKDEEEIVEEKEICSICNSDKRAGMILCQNKSCKQWIHWRCDQTVRDEKTANKTVRTYKCPGCREKSVDTEMQSSPEKENKNESPRDEKQINQHRSSTSIETESEGEDSLNLSVESVIAEIESIPDSIRSDIEVDHKEITEKLNNISLKEPETEKKKKKVRGRPRLDKEKDTNSLQHRSKNEILGKYSKLQKQNDVAKETITSLQTEISELKEKLRIEEDYHQKYDQIQEMMSTVENDSIDKIKYEAEVKRQSDEKALQEQLQKLEETRKRNTEKQKEINELKKVYAESTDELNSYREKSQKDTALIVSNEKLLKLREEKILSQDNIITQLEEKTKEMTEKDDQEVQELKKEIEKLKNQKTRIEKEYLEKYTQFVVEMEEKTTNLTNKIKVLTNERSELEKQIMQSERNDNADDIVTRLNKQVEASEEIIKKMRSDEDNYKDEIRKLEEELKNVAEATYKEIEKQIQPKNKKKGLPNINHNMCFLLAPSHLLAATMHDEIQNSEDSELKELLKIAKDCMEGIVTETEAKEASEKLWEYTKKKWPMYTTEEERSKQEDAAEILLKLIAEEGKIAAEVKTTIGIFNTCNNAECVMMTHSEKSEEFINVMSIPDTPNEITSLQEIINQHAAKQEETECHMCGMTGTIRKEVIKSPNIMIIQANRVTTEGKNNTDILCKAGTVIVKEKEKRMKYQVEGVITHNGEVKENGHYVCNLLSKEKQWYQIDDDKMLPENQAIKSNKGGTIFLLRKIDNTANQRYKEQASDKHQTGNYQQVRQSRWELNYDEQDNCQDQNQNTSQNWSDCEDINISETITYNRRNNYQGARDESRSILGVQRRGKQDHRQEYSTNNYSNKYRRRNREWNYDEQEWEENQNQNQNDVNISEALTSRNNFNGREEREQRGKRLEEQRKGQQHQNDDYNPNNYKKFPCKYYKTGSCKYGQDCRYKHETCRYFIRGHCKYNENCKYPHVIRRESYRNVVANSTSNSYYSRPQTNTRRY